MQLLLNNHTLFPIPEIPPSFPVDLISKENLTSNDLLDLIHCRQPGCTMEHAASSSFFKSYDYCSCPKWSSWQDTSNSVTPSYDVTAVVLHNPEEKEEGSSEKVLMWMISLDLVGYETGWVADKYHMINSTQQKQVQIVLTQQTLDGILEIESVKLEKRFKQPEPISDYPKSSIWPTWGNIMHFFGKLSAEDKALRRSGRTVFRTWEWSGDERTNSFSYIWYDLDQNHPTFRVFKDIIIPVFLGVGFLLRILYMSRRLLWRGVVAFHLHLLSESDKWDSEETRMLDRYERGEDGNRRSALSDFLSRKPLPSLPLQSEKPTHLS
jgi:hypothetical protein